MAFSIHIPLKGGTLKVKSANRLRSAETHREVPVFALFGVYFCWWAREIAEREKATETIYMPEYHERTSVVWDRHAA
ncbi:MAG: hypothetical protein KGL46_06595 [Hyphomicrobiales bacterium]|nr:hypothetical protein [Hyphomicrobiales bacterium]